MIGKALAMVRAELSWMKRLWYHRMVASPKNEAEIIKNFHQLLYLSKIWSPETTYPRWRGIQIAKHPNDIMSIQQILWETKPGLYIETGTYHGGSALFVADMMDIMGIDQGKVISIDKDHPADLPDHPRIIYHTGSSVGDGTKRFLKEDGIMDTDERIMVSLDSDHSKSYVLRELALYAALVSPGCYLIVEDTAFNGHPISPEFGPGPMEALDEWLPTEMGQRFSVDRYRELGLVTSNPRGFLRRKGYQTQTLDGAIE